MARKLGTGKISDDAGARKWAGGVKSQIASATHHKGLNARYVPLTQITLDPENPRQLAISIDQLKYLREMHPLQREWLQQDSEIQQSDWWDQYSEEISKSLTGKAYIDFIETALLALSIKSHDRLINPVTVYPDDSGSELKLIAGERRYLAHLMLGEEVIAARILSHAPNQMEKDILQWEENNQRSALSLHEQLINLSRLLKGWEKRKGKPLSVSQMVAMAGIPRVTAHRYLTVIRYPHPQLMAAIKDGKISSLRKAADLAALSVDELNETLSPKSSTLKSTTRVFKIKRSSDYTAIKAILHAAAEQLGGKTYLGLLENKPLDSAEDIANAFDELAGYICNKDQDL